MQTTEERYLAAKRALFDKVYADLNERQREAVYTVNNPLLVLAGAGSGKTTVLVRRIAFIIRYGNAYMSSYVPYDADDARVKELENALSLPAGEIAANILPEFANNACDPYRVLAITFTNKAANEIKERLAKMFPEDEGATASEICTGTFHSVCVRVLRRYAERLGYKQNFTIYDTDDSKKAMLTAMERCKIDEKIMPIKSVLGAVSRAKDKLQTPDDYAAEAGKDFRKEKIAKIYEAYQQILRESNAMDFDDLIMQTVLLLRKETDVREAYQKRFKYVLVDEFQDTNVAQLALTALFSDLYKNLMVVGDDDQSIYRFRGATIENILTFDKIYPDAKVVKLEQNYRSTQTILDAANAVIGHNVGRHSKELWTAAGEGAKIHLALCEDQNTEARYAVDVVSRAVSKKEATYRDFAILYRTNAQAQSLEKAFARSAIPYRVLGGTRFSDRKEIRDAVAYLQLISNRDDNVRLNRIINEPKRGIGNTTLSAVAQIALEQNCSQFEILSRAAEFPALSRSKDALTRFAGLINELTEAAETLPLDLLFDLVLDKSGYRLMLEAAGPEEAERLENLDEFKSGILEYIKENEEPTLRGFLEETALVADVDRYDESADAVVMMTVHSAKGLEFPVVILPGMEDGLFPGMQTITAGDAELEEERRLAYVAITRAKRELYILHTRNRLLYGQTMYNPLSRFVGEIPEALLDVDEENAPEQHSIPRGNRGYGYGDYDDGYVDFGAFGEKSKYGGDPARSRSNGGTRSFGNSSAPRGNGQTPVWGGYPSSAGSRPTGISRPVPGSRPMGGSSPIAGSRPAGISGAAPRKEPAKPTVVFAPGDRVKHMTFGEGEVLSVKPMGADILYEVAFDTAGTKKLMATYAKLTKIG